MRLRRRILRIILFLLAVPVILCGALYGFHKISLWAESRKYPPVGKMVEVNGHQMHVYGEGDGNGNETLVFLSGSGTAAPALDFKALYSRLSDQYHIVVVERAGYGFSETAVRGKWSLYSVSSLFVRHRSALLGTEISR